MPVDPIQPHQTANAPYNPKRTVKVDGIHYSLETGDRLGKAARARASRQASPLAPHHALPERPLPKGIGLTGRGHTIIEHQPEYESMHPHHVSHPALPLPQSRANSLIQGRSRRQRSFVGRVIVNSFKVTHDRRSTNAVLIATLLSPFYWLVVASPWLITAYLHPQGSGWRRLTRFINWIVGLTLTQVSWILAAILISLGLIWVIRHAFLLVSYAVHVRQIDHRLSDTTILWWAGLAKIGRSLALAALDLVAHGLVITAAGLAIATLLWRPGSANLFYQGLGINFLLFIGLLLLVVISIHRPLARVMLAATNQSLSSIMTKSFGMLLRNLRRGLILSIWWLLMTLITLTLLVGISWATLGYGLATIPPGWLARGLLACVAAGLTYVVSAAYLLWSQGYWALVYHDLAHLSYPSQVALFFTTEPHTIKRRQILVRLIGLLLIISLLVGAWAVLAHQSLNQAWQSVQHSQPQIDNWLKQR